MKLQQTRKPGWGQLYLGLVLMTGLLILANRLISSVGWRALTEMGVVLVSYTLVELWLRANTVAFLREKAGQYIGQVIEVEAPAEAVLLLKPHHVSYQFCNGSNTIPVGGAVGGDFSPSASSSHFARSNAISSLPKAA